MNRLTCTACHRPIANGDAVIRGNLHEQEAWHPACFTVVRATKDICTKVADADYPVGGTLSERLERAGYVR